MGVPGRINVCFGVVFSMPLRVIDPKVNLSGGCSVVKMLLNMGFDGYRVSDDIIVETDILEFNRIFVSVKNTVNHRGRVSLEFRTSFVNSSIDLLPNLFDVLYVAGMIKFFPLRVGISNLESKKLVYLGEYRNIQIEGLIKKENRVVKVCRNRCVVF